MSSTRLPIGHDAAGQPRTYRLQRPLSRDAAYRRLVITILGLDVQTLASDLRAGASARAITTASDASAARRLEAGRESDAIFKGCDARRRRTSTHTGLWLLIECPVGDNRPVLGSIRKLTTLLEATLATTMNSPLGSMWKLRGVSP